MIYRQNELILKFYVKNGTKKLTKNQKVKTERRLIF